MATTTIRCTAWISYDFCKDMPESLTTDDGRVFRLRKWAPVAEHDKYSEVTCVLVPDVKQFREKSEAGNVSN